MNLHGLVSGMINTVNPAVPLQIQVSLGNVVSIDGTPVPSYASPIVVMGQVQPLSQSDLRQVEALNLQGTMWAIYINGNIDGVVRYTAKGGDKVLVSSGPNAGQYLVTHVEEAWPDWCKAICTLQNGS